MHFWQWVGAPCCVVCTAATGGTPHCRREGGIENLYPSWHSGMYVLHVPVSEVAYNYA